MNKSIYAVLMAIIRQYMDLEASNNLCWGGNFDDGPCFQKTLFNECGYDIEDWSWYDGPIVKLNHKEYPEIYASYAACANTYAFHVDFTGDEVYINVCIEEVLKSTGVINVLHADQNKRNSHTNITSLLPRYSPEFNDLVKELKEWNLSFDRNTHSEYDITIHIGKGVNTDEL